MANAPKVYTRLPGRGRRKGTAGIASYSNCTLWMGPDHLLLVERFGYTENYKRFYFNDIQAITIRRTSSATIASIVMLLLALLFALWGMAVHELGLKIFIWILGAPLALFCPINFWRGPSCVTNIQTAVQTEQVPPWNRLPALRKGVAAVRPHLEQAQGQVDPNDLKTQWLEGIQREAQTPPPGP